MRLRKCLLVVVEVVLIQDAHFRMWLIVVNIAIEYVTDCGKFGGIYAIQSTTDACLEAQRYSSQHFVRSHF